jgi:hypothetical protein
MNLTHTHEFLITHITESGTGFAVRTDNGESVHISPRLLQQAHANLDDICTGIIVQNAVEEQRERTPWVAAYVQERRAARDVLAATYGLDDSERFAKDEDGNTVVVAEVGEPKPTYQNAKTTWINDSDRLWQQVEFPPTIPVGAVGVPAEAVQAPTEKPKQVDWADVQRKILSMLQSDEVTYCETADIADVVGVETRKLSQHLDNMHARGEICRAHVNQRAGQQRATLVLWSINADVYK